MPKRGEDGNGNVEYQVLTDRLIKSPFDPKDYKIIRLANQVTCTLISNMTKAHQNMHMMQMNESQPKVEAFNREYPNFANDNVDQVIVERVNVLENFAENTERTPNQIGEQAIAIITFESGQLQDPYEFQGLSHLLEHSVFLGSKNYPDKYGIFRLNKTQISAFTEADGTSYSVQSGLEDFSQSVKYFCDLLINPRLSDAEIEDEVKAVEAEFLLRRNEVLLKVYGILSSFSSTGHPCGKFDCGNSTSLLKNGLGNVIREWKKHAYFGQNMSIVLSAPLSMKSLVQFAIQHFSTFPSALDNQIPSSPLPSENLTKFYGPPFAGPSNRFNSMNFISPVSRYTKELIITWSIPPEFWKNFDCKPVEFVAHLINNLPNSRLIDFLKKNGNAIDSMAWNWLKTSFGSYFSIHIFLTKEGLLNQNDVLKFVFSYLKGLRNFVPNSGQLFEEKRQAESNHFHYVDSHRTSLENYHYHNWTVPLKKMNSFNKLCAKFDLNEILKVVDHLANPELANIIFVAENGYGDTHLNSPDNIHRTKYSNQSIPSDWLQSWKTVEPCLISPSLDAQISRFGLDCHLTCPPEYKNPAINDTQWTIGVTNKVFIQHRAGYGGGLLRHIMPFSQYTIGFSSDELYRESPMVSACVFVWTTILNVKLNDLHASNYKNLANFGFGYGYGALLFGLRGISFKLIDIFERVINTIGTFEQNLNEFEFNSAKTIILNNLDVLRYNGSFYLRDIQNTVLLDQYIPMIYIQWAISDLTFSGFVNFIRKFKSRMHIGGEIIGAISEDHRVRMSQAVQALNFEPMTKPKVTHVAKEIPSGDRCVRLRNWNFDDKNSYISNFYFIGNQVVIENQVEDQKNIENILQKMSGDILIQLRAHEQLGYVVYSALEDNFSALGVSINVILPTDKFSTDYVDERIDAYLQDFYKREIENNSEDKVKAMYATYLLPESPHMKKISFQLAGIPSDKKKQKKGLNLKEKIARDNYVPKSGFTSFSNNNNGVGDFRFGFSNNSNQNLGPFGGGSNTFGNSCFGQNSGTFGGGSNTFGNNWSGQNLGTFGGNSNAFGNYGQNSATFDGDSNSFGNSCFGQNSGTFGGGSMNTGTNSFGSNNDTPFGTFQNGQNEDFDEEYQFDFELPSENIIHSTNSYFITKIKEFKRSLPNCPNLNQPEKFMSTDE